LPQSAKSSDSKVADRNSSRPVFEHVDGGSVVDRLVAERVLAKEKYRKKQQVERLIAKSNRGSYISYFARTRPSVFILGIFTSVTLIFTFLLSLPVSSRSGNWTNFSTAFFTASSGISGTGMAVVSTGEYWSFFGQIVLLLLIQIGGLGVMTMASMIGFLVSKRMGLTTKMLAGSDIKTSKYGELGSLIKVIFVTMISLELIITVLLMMKFVGLHESFLDAFWQALFFSVSSFNNAGFNISSIDFHLFSSQWGIVLPILLSIFMGSIGFPVILNIVQAVKSRKLRTISLHSRIVLITFFVMNSIILIWFFVGEWNNSKLFPGELLDNPVEHASALTMAALTTQTSGFSVIDPNLLSAPTRLLTEIWMFVGGAPASTCSGIKVTTIAVLLLAVWAEFRGNSDITLFRKRLPSNSLKVAVTIFLCGIGVVVLFSFLLALVTNASFEVIQFDVVSAFANCGLSLGMISSLEPLPMIMMGVLMFLGRLGTMTVVSAITRENLSTYVRYPEENVILG
jgi:Trk-type K+ transport system membrane component